MAQDMRSWIEKLEEKGELIRIERPVDPLTEMGVLLWESKEKALFFEHLKNFPGWRSLGQAPGSIRNAALAFDVGPYDLVPEYSRRLARKGECRMVSGGPVKEKKFFGEEVNLRSLPVHISGSKDGGPFISSGLCVTKDPDTGARNLSFHRLQVKGERKTGILMVPRHAAMNYRKCETMGKPMPIAAVIGHHPMYYFAAATTGPYRMDELEVASALLGEAVELVRCETVDLEVPAHAEIVLEGEVLPHHREEEGPFSEFHDYQVSGSGLNPVVHFKAMTMRSDAIYKHIQNGSEVEGCTYHKVPMAVQIYNRLRNIGGYVDLKNVVVLPGIFGVVIQMAPRFQGEVKNVLLGALSSEYLHPKMVIAVDEDVDVLNPAEILWALSTRVDPARDIQVIPNTRVHPMDATGEEMVPPGGGFWQRLGSKVLIDATKPPLSQPEERAMFERMEPMGRGKISLKTVLEKTD